MSLDKVVASIEAKGIDGIRKTELKREFQNAKELDSILQELAITKEIFIERKGNSFYYWHKDYYLQKLLSTDQKFALMYTFVNSMRDSLNDKLDSLDTTLESVTKQVRDATEVIKIIHASGLKEFGVNDRASEQIKSPKISYDNFKEQLDQALASASSSIGWVELCNLRKSLCLKMKITQEQFYHTLEEVVSNNYDKYELSTGGEEGVQLRGMVHGFVRCI